METNLNFSTLAESKEFSQNIIIIMLENKGKDGLCRITLQDIGLRLKKSPCFVSRAIRRLQRCDDCITIINRGLYRVNYTDLNKKGPFIKVVKLLKAIAENPEIYTMTYSEQAKILEMTNKDLQMAYGYFSTITRRDKK